MTSLHYYFSDVPEWKKENEKNVKKIIENLKLAGVELTISDNQLTLAIDEYVFDKRNNRHKQKKYFNQEEQRYYMYSDIIYMLQTMSKRQVAINLKIPYPTFLLHCKKMENSIYYETVDKNKLKDLKYLSEYKGNSEF